MAAPCGFHEEDGFVEVVAHHGAEYEFGSGAAWGAEAEGEGAFAFEELDEDVVALDPLVVFAEMGEEVFGFGVGGLMIEQGVGGFAFHVGLAGEEEDLHGRFCGGERGGGDDEEREKAEGIHGWGGGKELGSSVAVGAVVSPTDERRGGVERGRQAVTCARGVRVHCGGHEPIQYPRCHPNRDRHHGPY